MGMPLRASDHLGSCLSHRNGAAFTHGSHGEILDAAWAGDERPITGVGAGVVYRHRFNRRRPESARAGDKELELVLPVKVCKESRIRRLFDQRDCRGKVGIVPAFHPFTFDDRYINSLHRP